MRHDPERVLDEFALGAAQFGEPVVAVLQLDIADLAIEQFEERLRLSSCQASLNCDQPSLYSDCS